MKRATTMLGALAVAAAGFLFAAPAAHAGSETLGGVTCTDYSDPGAVYPTDGTHFKVCFTGFDVQRMDDLYGQVQGLPTNNGSGNMKVRDLLEAKGVTYYHFKNRADMNNFMAAKFPSWSQFQNTTAVCGHSAYQAVPFGQTITSSIFDDCIIGGSTVPNPDLAKVASHESGHAFEFALAANKSPMENRSVGPAVSSGYRSLRDHDLTELNSLSMCTLFQGVPSDYEHELGATLGAVCTGGIQNPPYNTMMNEDIAKEKAPYFVNQTAAERYGELWAEQFSTIAGTMGGVTTPKKFVLTDNIVKDGRMDCTEYVVTSYWNTLLPPGPSNPHVIFKKGMTFAGCPNISEGDLK